MAKRESPLPGLFNVSISEEHIFQTFNIDDEDDTSNPPMTPVRSIRSHSVIVDDRCRKSLLYSTPPAGGSTVTFDGQVNSYNSLPSIYRKSHRHLGRLNTQLLEAVKANNVAEVHRLLENGANPNATCHTDFVSACHLATLAPIEIMQELLNHKVEKHRTDRLGRTPLHFAAWAGNVMHLALLLNFPEELQNKLAEGVVTREIEDEVKRLNTKFNSYVNVKCKLGELNVRVPRSWRDNIDHNCKEIDLPFFQPGWTPLHAASFNARHQSCRLLLAAGADPCVRDVIGRSPLDVAGSACYFGQTQSKHRHLVPTVNIDNFTEVVKLLLTQSCKRMNISQNTLLDNPLHTAAELGNLEAITLLLQAGISPKHRNRAGLTPLHICVKKNFQPHLQTLVYFDQNNKKENSSVIDVKDKDGYTVLHFAVINNWAAGVSVALDAGADIVSRACDGETPLHAAAALGNLNILKGILAIAKHSYAIDVLNQRGETPLFKAVRSGHIDGVKLLLNEGASIKITIPKEINVLHIAAELGHSNILKILLRHDYNITRAMVNYVTVDDRRGYGPLHFAVVKGHIECVKILLSNNAFVSLKSSGTVHKGSTPLHIAARKKFLEIAKILIRFDSSTIDNVDTLGWTPLHTAGYYASRDVITLLIHEGADLSATTSGQSKFKRTAIEIIMNNLSKPTAFMESIFDSCIKSNDLCPQDPDLNVTVDYRLLLRKNVPSDRKYDERKKPKMTLIEAFLKTGNRSGQKRLLIHPLVESFLCLKWQALLPFFYTMILIYGLFLVSFTMYLMSIYLYTDKETSTHGIEKAYFMNTYFWLYALYVTIAILCLQEIMFWKAAPKLHWRQLETWLKFTIILQAAAIPILIGLMALPDYLSRHISTVTLLLCWLEMTFLLSRFPKWGYYVLMFKKVSTNVIKILLTFAFLIIGFTLSFMIQFHIKSPFQNFWAALVKIMVMMTSEFDYDDLVKKEGTSDKKDEVENFIGSPFFVRFVFLIFLIFGAVVLMNLMVGVAVHDLNNLEVLGHIMRLEKQVEFLASLETLFLNRFVLRLVTKKLKHNLEFSKSLSVITLKPCQPSWSYFKAIPPKVREAIFEKALSLKMTSDYHTDSEIIRTKLCKIHEILTVNRHFNNSDDLNVNNLSRKLLDELNSKVDTILQLITTHNLYNL